MTKNLTISLKNIKNIKKGELTIPIEKGVYAITGENGSGKSTLISCIARLVVDYSLYSLSYMCDTADSEIKFLYDSIQNTYKPEYKSFTRKTKKGHGKTYTKTQRIWTMSETNVPEIQFKGMYEGSFFFGSRFKDSHCVDELLKNKKIEKDGLFEADAEVSKNVSQILHGNQNNYSYLKKVSAKHAKKLGLSNTPYFMEYGDSLVSQYRMSSGECLLISLFDFINNTIISKNQNDSQEPTLLIIDEIEAALHPSAIKRLLDYLNQLAEKHNFVVIISSHSAEVIRQIKPNNLYNIEMLSNGNLKVSNPCYPAYAIRDIYTHNGFDFVVLVEDTLAKKYLEHLFQEQQLQDYKLIHILPTGGWENVLKLYEEVTNENTFGIATKVFCVLDGDIKTEFMHNDKYKDTRSDVLFLPFSSIEKFLTLLMENSKYAKIKDKLNSYIFTKEKFEHIYYKVETKDNAGKNFYKLILKHLQQRRITEDDFLNKLCQYIDESVDKDKIISELKCKFLKE